MWRPASNPCRIKTFSSFLAPAGSRRRAPLLRALLSNGNAESLSPFRSEARVVGTPQVQVTLAA
jgi:hypothetical protein